MKWTSDIVPRSLNIQLCMFLFCFQTDHNKCFMYFYRKPILHVNLLCHWSTELSVEKLKQVNMSIEKDETDNKHF